MLCALLSFTNLVAAVVIPCLLTHAFCQHDVMPVTTPC